MEANIPSVYKSRGKDQHLSCLGYLLRLCATVVRATRSAGPHPLPLLRCLAHAVRQRYIHFADISIKENRHKSFPCNRVKIVLRLPACIDNERTALRLGLRWKNGQAIENGCGYPRNRSHHDRMCIEQHRTGVHHQVSTKLR